MTDAQGACSCFGGLLQLYTRLVGTGALEEFGVSPPNPQLLRFRLGLGRFVFLLEAAKLGAGFRLVSGSQAPLEHLEADIAPEQEAPYKHGCDDAVVLVALVYSGAYPLAQNVMGEPVERFGSVGLRCLSEVRAFGGVNARQSNGNLQRGSSEFRAGRGALLVELTVLFLKSTFLVGTCRSHPQPIRRPPGVWYIRHPSPEGMVRLGDRGGGNIRERCTIANTRHLPKHGPFSKEVGLNVQGARDAANIGSVDMHRGKDGRRRNRRGDPIPGVLVLERSQVSIFSLV